MMSLAGNKNGLNYFGRAKVGRRKCVQLAINLGPLDRDIASAVVYEIASAFGMTCLLQAFLTEIN